MYFGLVRTMAVLLCLFLYVCASSLREQSSMDLKSNQTESKSKAIEHFTNSQTSEDVNVADDQASDTLSLKKIRRKARDTKYSDEQPMPPVPIFRMISEGPSSSHGGNGMKSAWDTNRGVIVESKPSRHNQVLGKSGSKRICFRRKGIMLCKPLSNVRRNPGVTNSFKDIRFGKTASNNVLDRAMFDLEGKTPRNKLESLRPESLQEMFKSAEDHQPSASQVEDFVAYQSGVHKRDDPAALTDSDGQQEPRIRPRFYPNDGPKRDWKVNLMRVWG